jgi:hypothetical protein
VNSPKLNFAFHDFYEVGLRVDGVLGRTQDFIADSSPLARVEERR